ncbi:MAG: serine/threonine protein phosphatase [Hyphomicrobiales bacterium]|nr:serine/threonine protein phosphatase [Hyphomicrobiales bacterium]MCP5370116.1 serine/threonine protein phosphatase [Hyphomicrobiales bacterium]
MQWLKSLTGAAPAAPTPETPRVPDGSRVYAVGDVHGRTDLVRRLLDLIVADAAGAPEARRVIVFLGDYVDRGPDVAGTVDLLLQGPPPGFDYVLLKGNHEDFLLRLLEGTRHLDAWLMNGGIQTLESYGLDMTYLPAAPQQATRLRQDFLAALPDDHLAFYRSLGAWHREGDYLFVHAGVRPGTRIEKQREEDLLWIRDRFLESDEDFGQVVVHGHTIVGTPEVRRNRIGIDTGAWRSGRLTCLALVGDQRRFLQT